MITPEELTDTMTAIQSAISRQEITTLMTEASKANRDRRMTLVDFKVLQQAAQQRLKQLGKKQEV